MTFLILYCKLSLRKGSGCWHSTILYWVSWHSRILYHNCQDLLSVMLCDKNGCLDKVFRQKCFCITVYCRYCSYVIFQCKIVVLICASNPYASTVNAKIIAVAFIVMLVLLIFHLVFNFGQLAIKYQIIHH